MCPYPWYQIMRNSKDKKQHRYQMAQYALRNGVKPTARLYATHPITVRKWMRRFIKGGYDSLNDISRRPRFSPNAICDNMCFNIVKLKKKYKRLGADQIKIVEHVPVSARTIRKIWRNYDVSSRKRKRKHVIKQNLREVKKQYALFERTCEDTKHLRDIPMYWPQMMAQKLPKIQYTFREVSCGVMFTAFADECSLTNADLFARYINDHLKKYDLLLPKGIRQTDNGAEYCGAWSSVNPSAYTRTIEAGGQIHNTIPPGAHRFQSDVETVHNLIEVEFYDLEKFKDRDDFIDKALTYQTFFNFERPNMYKEGKTPWQLAQDKMPNLPQAALLLPPIDLDMLLFNSIDLYRQGGYDVPSNPSVSTNVKSNHRATG